MRILRDIAASQHATALILEKIASGLSVKKSEANENRFYSAILKQSDHLLKGGAAQSGKTRKNPRFNIGEAFNGGSQKNGKSRGKSPANPSTKL